jgi:DNA-binding beta-propeller fold protein YncE
VDANGHQFICEFGNSRITILDAQDQLIETVGSAGGRPGQLANPWAIALDSKGNLYVADSQNHRVQKLIRKP